VLAIPNAKLGRWMLNLNRFLIKSLPRLISYQIGMDFMALLSIERVMHDAH
jgi:hypothetical protein